MQVNSCITGRSMTICGSFAKTNTKTNENSTKTNTKMCPGILILPNAKFVLGSERTSLPRQHSLASSPDGSAGEPLRRRHEVRHVRASPSSFRQVSRRPASRAGTGHCPPTNPLPHFPLQFSLLAVPVAVAVAKLQQRHTKMKNLSVHQAALALLALANCK